MDDDPQTQAHRQRHNSYSGQIENSNNGAPIRMENGNAKTVTEESDLTRWSGSEVETEDLLQAGSLDDDEEIGLTQNQRKRRHRRERNHMRLDERTAANGDVSSNEARLTTANILRTYCVNALLIGLWYTFSISISVYNKWMFSKENLHFPFPLFTTCAHMLVQFSLAGAVLYFLPHLRPRVGGAAPSAEGYRHVGSDEEYAHPPKKQASQPIMTRWFYLTRIGPCGTATALDIGLGNFSLRFIRLTFYTMCKSSVLAFVLLFALLFKLEQPSWRLGAVIAFMTGGVIMMVAGETAFDIAGFALVMSASFCSGFRWSLTQILLLRNPATNNPFSSIFFLTPVMFAALLILALPIEGPSNLAAGFRDLAETKGTVLAIVIMLCPGILAFMMVAAEFTLLKRTSVVTLSVCGIFKEVLTISTAAKAFGDELSPINISGLVVTVVSIAAYNYVKYAKMRDGLRQQAQAMVTDDVAQIQLADLRGEDFSRNSTGEKTRDSLSIQTVVDGHHEHAQEAEMSGDGSARSPSERSKDLD